MLSIAIIYLTSPHPSTPHTHISLLGEDGVCFLGVKCFQDHLFEVILYHCLHVINTCT